MTFPFEQMELITEESVNATITIEMNLSNMSC